MTRISMIAVAALLLASPAFAADKIEAVGAQKCGGAVKSYEVEFLAPENGQLEATATAKVGGATNPRQDTANLSLDGQPCANAKCSFRASKGQTYRIVATSEIPNHDDLCISVARP